MNPSDRKPVGACHEESLISQTYFLVRDVQEHAPMPEPQKPILARAVTVRSAEVVGLEVPLVDVEVHAAAGLPHVDVVGLAEPCVRESKQRVRAAIVASGFRFPDEKITVNLAPASVKKTGCGFDLAIALGILLATERLRLSSTEEASLKPYLLLGELSLNGSLRAVDSAFGVVLAARDRGIRKIILPVANAREAAWVSGVELYPANHFLEVVRHFENTAPLVSFRTDSVSEGKESLRVVPEIDLAEIRGQKLAKSALVVAAAGGHNMLLSGPPGAGKTMLARSLAGLLPDLSQEEALETTRIHSSVGMLSPESGLLRRPPFRAPHHSMSDAGLVGGGKQVSPGEISLAHNGVLFLDELPEFRRNVLEILREPLESGRVQLSRASGVAVYPARIQLIAAMNPCPCGFHGSNERLCRCTPAQVQQYAKRLSGPLLDRLDLRLHLSCVEQVVFFEDVGEDSLSTAAARERIEKARDFQARRTEGKQIMRNARIPAHLIDRYCPLTPAAQKALLRGATLRRLSGRGLHRLIRISRTLSDLAGEEILSESSVYDALALFQEEMPQ